MSDAPSRVPRKWLGHGGGWIIFGSFTAFWLLNLLFDQIVDHQIVLSPNSLVFGGFGMTGALIYVLCYRLRPQEGVTALRLLLAFLLGGLFATEAALYVEILISLVPVGAGGHSALLVRALAGVVEEGLKLLAVVIAARGLANRSAHNGLFLGGAVGLGFAAFEDMRYAFESLTSPPIAHSPFWSVITITLGRDLLGPLEHPLLTALTAAALFAATCEGRFRITARVIVIFLAVAIAHGAIDSIPGLLALWLPVTTANGLGALLALVIILLIGRVWLQYSRQVRARMLADEQSALAESAPT